MYSDLISIVIPIYNAEKYLDICIESILHQSYEHFEVLLIDDGSTDKSGDKCEYYASKDNRIKVFHRTNSGLVASWKYGVSHAKANYIAFIDADDWVSKDYLQGMVDRLPCDVVLTKAIRVSTSEKLPMPALVKSGRYDKKSIEEDIFPVMLNAGGFQKRALPFSRWAKLIRKDLILQNQVYCWDRTTYSEDVNILFPVFIDANTMHINSDSTKSIYYYRFNSESMLHKYDKNAYKSILYVNTSLINICKEKNHIELLPQVYADFLSAATQYYKNELINPEGRKSSKKNIKKMANTALFQTSSKIVDWTNYGLLNKVIINSMIHYRSLWSNLVFEILKRMKLQRRKKDKILSGEI